MSVKLKRTDNEVTDSSGYAIPLVSDTENVWIDESTFRDKTLNSANFYYVESQEELDAIGTSARCIVIVSSSLTSLDFSNAPERALFILNSVFTISNLGRYQSVDNISGFNLTINDIDASYQGSLSVLGDRDITINIPSTNIFSTIDFSGSIKCKELIITSAKTDFLDFIIRDNKNLNDVRAGSFAASGLLRFNFCNITTLIQGNVNCPIRLTQSFVKESILTASTINGKTVTSGTTNIIAGDSTSELFTLDKTTL